MTRQEEEVKGQRVGYVRVRTDDQHPDRQLAGIETDRTFTDRCSGKTTKRSQLDEMIGYVRDGDTLYVHSMDRLARNLDDLRRLVSILTSKGVRIEFVKEHLAFTGDDSPMATLMLSVMGSFAEFERALIRERQREGIAQARKRGAYRRTPWSKLSPEQREELRRRLPSESVVKLAAEYGISHQTVYRYLRSEDESPVPAAES